MERTPLVAGNWKMFKTRAEAADFCAALLPLVDDLDEVDLARLPAVHGARPGGRADRRRRRRRLGPERRTTRREGAFTGEISCRMLIDAGATGVLLGHSERRALFGETDEALARKLTAALAHGLEPVLCIGESEAERDGGATESRLRTQLEGALGRSDLLAGAAGHDRLRAGVGDRHRPQRDARAGAGDARVHPRCALGALRRGVRGRDAHPLRRLGQARQRGLAARRSRTWTARSSAARASTRRASRRSRARPSPADDRAGRARRARRLRPRARRAGNAVALARTPVFDALWERCPHTTLMAAGRAVGLPEGQMGNSEVGPSQHRRRAIVAQDLVRIGTAVADGSLARNPALQAAFAAAAGGRGVLHVAGLVSDGGVHSHVDHLRAIVGCGARRRRAARRRARLHGRPRRLAASGGGAAGGLEREWAGTGRRSRPSSAATTPWIAITAPSAPSCARAALVDGVGEHAESAGPRSRRAMRAG